MKTTLFEDVTTRIVAEMEEGRLPWVKEWDAGNVPTRPVNASTDAAYNGVNILLLWGRFSSAATPSMHGSRSNRLRHWAQTSAKARRALKSSKL